MLPSFLFVIRLLNVYSYSNSLHHPPPPNGYVGCKVPLNRLGNESTHTHTHSDHVILWHTHAKGAFGSLPFTTPVGRQVQIGPLMPEDNDPFYSWQWPLNRKRPKKTLTNWAKKKTKKKNVEKRENNGAGGSQTTNCKLFLVEPPNQPQDPVRLCSASLRENVPSV